MKQLLSQWDLVLAIVGFVLLLIWATANTKKEEGELELRCINGFLYLISGDFKEKATSDDKAIECEEENRKP